MPDSTEALPKHVEDSIRTMAALHAEHHGSASSIAFLLDTLTVRASRPVFLIGVTLLIMAWIALNLILPFTGRPALDAPPFGWLQTATSVAALVMTCLILTTQRRDDKLSTRRQQLTLELVILSDQKSSKAIELLEALRRDDPAIADRPDSEARDMSMAADPAQVLDAIRDTHDPHTPEAAVARHATTSRDDPAS